MKKTTEKFLHGSVNYSEVNKRRENIQIQIDDKGEICAWGLDKSSEVLLMGLTGNQKLSHHLKAMSYKLCG